MRLQPPTDAAVRSRNLAGVLLLAFLLMSTAGCASSGSASDDPDYNIDQGEIATLPLPNSRKVAHHPDSLAHLSIVPKEGKISFEHERSYENMILEWTSGIEGGRTNTFQTHATLWSRELSLLSLEPENSLQILSQDLARDLLAQRQTEYDSLVQIDVYVFARSTRLQNIQNLRIDVGRRVYLEDGAGNTYRPERIEANAPLEVFYRDRQTLYGRNAVFFKRIQNGKDLLDTDRLELHVGRARFVWRFPRPDDGRAASQF